MSATGFLDACGFFPAAGGTADFVVSAAITGYQTPASAGAVNGAVYSYRAQSSDMSEWEIGFGAYATGTTTLARTTVVASSTGSKVNFSAPPQVYITALSEDLYKTINARETLTADRTYYVDTTNGNDSNSGLAAGSGNAFKTIQKAYDVIAGKLDLAGYTVTIQIADGTYAPSSGINALLVSKPWTGGGSIVVQGNSSTPANVVLSTTSADVIRVTAPLPGILTLKDFKLQTATSGGGILLQAAGTIQFGNLNFGACTGDHYTTGAAGAFIKAISNYSITGGANRHALATNPSSIVASAITISLTGTPTFVAFAQASGCSVMDWSGTTFSGSANGQRYSALLNGVIYTGGGGANFFPGSTAGATSSGGQYL